MHVMARLTTPSITPVFRSAVRRSWPARPRSVRARSACRLL